MTIVNGPALAERLSRRVTQPLTRFAPAPTGYLHIGHVVNAIFVWGLSNALGGRVLLRIEDHDRQRCRPAFEQALLDDLDWLGFAPGIYETDDFRAGTCPGRQSDRDAEYRRALDPLIDQGRVFACECTRAGIRHQAPGTRDPGPGIRHQATGTRDQGPGTRDQGAEVRYPGTCRDRGLPIVDGLGWRLRIDPGMVTFDDGLLGKLTQDPDQQCGDLLLRDRLGNWTYQWAATTDDTLQNVDLVIRGIDLLASTGRQIALARSLGRSRPPVYVHHPLVMKSATQKLSKSDGDTAVRDRRANGARPEQLIAEAARLVGLHVRSPTLAARDVGNLFR
jgi:glutamyl/glutaminyl-tRNA synthetase